MNDYKKILYIVHCVDTEGPLDESIQATFQRLSSIFGITLKPTKDNLLLLQNKKLNFFGMEEAVAKCFSPQMLQYNSDWQKMDLMLAEILSQNFRNQYLDDFNRGWIYSWHCMDHMNYVENPRKKDVGYGNIFRFYKNKLTETQSSLDEINWHFHPLSVTKNPIHAATSYINSYGLLTQILARRIIEDEWFPIVNRPGFHAERPDSHAFLEQWIPFDYANQVCNEAHDQPDASLGRFGDWRRSPKTWRGYNPDHRDYQLEGGCKRKIFRCLNVGTRFRTLTEEHIREAFLEADLSGGAILSFANHDYRDMRPDINHIRMLLENNRKNYPEVLIKFAGAEEAARALMGNAEKISPRLSLEIVANRTVVKLIEGELFGPQPFLAFKTKQGDYFHDNFDIDTPEKIWSYTFDDQTIELSNIAKVGVGTAGKYGGSCVIRREL